MNLVNLQLVGWFETQRATSTEIAGFVNPAYSLKRPIVVGINLKNCTVTIAVEIVQK